MTSVTVAGGSFDVPRRVTKKGPNDTAKRDRLVRYGIGLSIAGILAADTFVLNGMLRHAAGGVADVLLDPPTSAAATAAPESSAAGEGFAALNVPADRSMGAKGRTFGKWTDPVALTSVSAAEAPAFVPAIPDLGGAVLGPQTGPADNSGGGGGGGGGAEDSNPIPEPVPTLLQEVANTIRNTLPIVGPTAATIIETGAGLSGDPTPPAPSSTVDPVDAVVDTVDAVVEPVVEPVAASTASVPAAGSLLP